MFKRSVLEQRTRRSVIICFGVLIEQGDYMYITNIQRFSLHDGPGIRTTVFFKGCTLHCPWCSNPENICRDKEEYQKDGQRGIYGVPYSESMVYNEVIKDENYYFEEGGVTLSGGEALLYVNQVLPLLKRFHKDGISIAVETSLFIPTEHLKAALPYIQYFIVDMKIMDEQKCNRILGGNLDLYKRNLEYLTSKRKIVIRIPVISGYTDDKENIVSMIAELKKNKNGIEKIELLRGHHLGNPKYRTLGLNPPIFQDIDSSIMNSIKILIQAETGIHTFVCHI